MQKKKETVQGQELFTQAEINALHKIKRSAMSKIVRIMKLNKQEDRIEHYRSRVKSFESIAEKWEKRYGDEPFDKAKIIEEYPDLLGIRIVTHFLTDVYEVADIVKEQFEVVQVQDYIMNPKSTGYRCLHMLIKLPVQPEFAWEYGKFITCELQIRTTIMDAWASIDHLIGYKNPQVPVAEQALKKLSDELFQSDMTMETVHKLNNMHLER